MERSLREEMELIPMPLVTEMPRRACRHRVMAKSMYRAARGTAEEENDM